MNNMVVGIVFMLIVFSILGGGMLYLKKTMATPAPSPSSSSDSDSNSKEASLDGEIISAQEFIPFVDIRDSMINLGDFKYRAVLECSSVNYMLKTEKEREIIEQSFQRFISSVTFPISFHIQTRAIDNTEVVRALEKDISEIELSNPLMKDYANMYLESMKSFDVYIGKSKQKKKYIIISYEDARNLGELNDAEKEEHSRNQLQERVDFVKNQLSGVGVKAERLDNQGLKELLYSTYHRENVQYDMVQALTQGDFVSSVVTGAKKVSNSTAEEKIDLELVRIQKLIKEEYLDLTLGRDNSNYKKMVDVYKNLDKVRELMDKPYGGELKIMEGIEKDKEKKMAKNTIKTKSEAESNFVAQENEKIEEFSPNLAKSKKVTEDKDDFTFDFTNSDDEQVKDDDFTFDFTNSDDEQVKDDDFTFDFTNSNDEQVEDDDFTFDFTNSDDEQVNDDDFTFDFTNSDDEQVEDDDFTFDFTNSDDEQVNEDKNDFSFDFDNSQDLDKLFEDEDDDIVITRPNRRR